MHSVLWGIVGLLFAAFLLIVLRGAPYVPTHAARAKRALDMLDLPAGGTIVDLGSGDGIVLKLAAERGLQAIGFELNPFLCIVSWIRCWPYRRQVTIRWRDFWTTPIPKETDAIFIFLAGPYMKKLSRKINQEAAQRKRPLAFISYGFEVPGLRPEQQDGDIYIYHITNRA